MSRRSFGQAERRRGQTLVDFVVGIAILLVTLSFIVVFVPQLTLPFEDTEQPVVAERGTSELTYLITEEDGASKLNESCTVAFFTQDGGAGCQFATDDAVTEQLGIDGSYTVNVTLRTAPSDTLNSTVLCGDNASVDGCDGDGEQLAEGPAVPDGEVTVSTVRRTVFTEERNAVLELVVW